MAPTSTTNDPCSAAKIDEAVVKHVSLNLTVDFEAKRLRGSAKYTVVAGGSGAKEVVLDTRNLDVKGAKDPSTGEALTHELQPPKYEVIGSALVVALPGEDGIGAGAESVVEVAFETTPESTAIQWLAPAQTAGGKHPYLFTQCQAIHARSFFPCQDTPAAKMTYDATITVPGELTAVMSAVPVGEPVAGEGGRSFTFEQKVPIPPYLSALAVGDLESRELGPRSRVWSEPSMVEAGVYEFADTNGYLTAAEDIAGPYVWGRYDLLLLPPSFPYGGMENPCLTFVTPTLLAGDRSQANVIAHEIAHSWFGNLVTNRSWESFWLNEGFTVFLERKILRKMFGNQVHDFHALQGLSNLRDDVNVFVQDGKGKYTRLEVDLAEGGDPDDAFSKVPYEKGFAFLSYLERQAGGPEVFEPFLREYISEHQYGVVTSAEFQAMFERKFPEAADGVDWEAWYRGEGMPPVDTAGYYDTSLADAANKLAERWHFADVLGVGQPDRPEGASASDVAGWNSDSQVAFLDRLIELRSMQPLSVATVKALDELYRFSASGNSEIKCSWYRLRADAGDAEVLAPVREMLRSQGRMKYLKPLYRALTRSRGAGFKQAALDTFGECRAGYHPIADAVLANLLGV